jgi:zinc/manganese transport system substrate-binding protein
MRTKAVLPVLLCLLATDARAETEVVASFSILGDMVERVVGDRAGVTTIVGPDADAHLYTPTVADALAVARADIVFVNGLGFETWSRTLIETAGSRAPVVVASRGVEPLRVDGEIDPHAWNALPNGAIYVGNIAEAMAEADPDNAAAYRADAAAYLAEIRALHAEALERLAALPADRRTVVTAHDAFGYLADAYGLEFLAPVGIDTEAEPSARALAALIDRIAETGAAALFVENVANPDLVQQIAEETGLAVGGRLYSDALSERGGPATGYLAMFRHNLEALLSALAGDGG